MPSKARKSRVSRRSTTRTNRRLAGVEGLETRALMAADFLATATLDTELLLEKSESAYIQEQPGTENLSTETAESNTSPALELDAEQLSSAIQESLDALFKNLSGEELDGVSDLDILGLNDLVDVADGLGALNPPTDFGGDGMDVPNFVNPSTSSGSDSSDPMANDASSLVSPSMDLSDHLNGLASTKDTTGTVHVVPGTTEGGENGELTWLTSDGTRHTYEDRSGDTDSFTGRQIIAGFRIESVKTNGTSVVVMSYVFSDGSSLQGRRATGADGSEDQNYQLSPARPADSMDPNADPQAVLLPHQTAPDFNPSDGMESPDQINPGEADDQPSDATKINPGNDILVNPAGEQSPAPEVSDEQVEYWKEKLREEAGGEVNPPGGPDTIHEATFAMMEAMPGDTNLDGKVDFTDFLQLSANFGARDAAFQDGDFDGDGMVGFGDFLILSEQFGADLTSV